MSDYVKSTNFAAKDALSSGDTNKIVKGTEINTEYDNIATAVSSQADKASPTFTGTANFAAITASSTITGSLTGNVTGNLTGAVTGSLAGGTGLPLTTGVTGTLPVANGGTGAATLTGYGAVVMNSAGTAATSVAPSTSGNLLTSNGTSWTSAAPPSSGVTSAVAGNGITVSGATGAVTISQDVYTGSSSSNTSFPIGTVVYLVAAAAIAPSRNQSITIYLQATNYYSANSTGNSGTLAGTWRQRGGLNVCCVSNASHLAQRTA